MRAQASNWMRQLEEEDTPPIIGVEERIVGALRAPVFIPQHRDVLSVMKEMHRAFRPHRGHKENF